jgi:1,4-dihydroxy-6-naphthoate synthase
MPDALTLAHSPDPDDVFMWWPITGMIDPSDPSRVVRPPALDTGGLVFRALPADIDVLNRRAIEHADLDITALSIGAYARVARTYRLTCMGSSMGEGYGPKVVARARELPPSPLIAVPGVRTTAFLVLSMLMGDRPFRHVEMPFDRILDAVASGQADAGLLIHQSQLVYPELGLVQVVDTGAWWREQTGGPLPLGGNAVRRDLDARFGPGTTDRVVTLLDRSIRFALEHRADSIDYCMRFAPELSREQAERYIDMYVSPLTLDAGEPGRRSIERLLAEGARRGLCPDAGPIDMLRPSPGPNPVR